MSEAITVLCPSCKASLKLKNRSAVGKRVPCPKCKKPFVVKAPAEEDDEMAFLNASESDAAMPVSDEDEEEAEVPAQPTPSTSRGSGSRKRKGKGKAAPPVNWLKPLLIGVTALVFVGLLVGGGMFAVSFIGGMSKNKIDLSYLPPESELIAHARVDEMLASPFLQPLMAKPELKQALDKLTNELHVSLGDIKSMTLGVSGMSKVNYSKAFAIPGMPGMGMPGMGQPGAMPAQAMPNVQSEFSQTRTVVVIRTSNALPADLMTKLTGYESVTHQGTNYYRPAAVQLRSTQPALCLTTPNILLVADESEIQRIAEKGPKQVRRADFDFVETGPQFVIAMLNKSTGASGTPAGGAPAGGMPGSMPGGGMPGMPGGGMPGMPGGGMPGGGMGPGAGASGGLGGLANAASLTNGKIKGWYVGISFTQDIEIQTGLNCPESAKDALADIDRELTKAKNDFPSQKAQLGMLAMMGLGDLVPHIESMVNSLNATGTGDVVKVNLKIPGGIAATIEKAVPAIMGMAGAGAGGNPFGNPADGDTPADESSSETPTGDDPAASQNPPGNP